MAGRKSIYQNETVYLPDIVRTGGPIITATFENCHLMGPAIVAILDNNHIEGVTFGIENDDIETILWEVPEGSLKVGLVGFQGCRLLGGRTTALGFAGTKAMLDMLRAAAAGK